MAVFHNILSSHCMKRFYFFILCLSAISTKSIGQDRTLFEKQLFIQGNDTLPCRILTPVNFNESKKYPLIIFLHGAGERGINNEAQLTWGADLFLDSMNRTNFPAIVVFPQCPQNDKWAEYNKNPKSDSTGYTWNNEPTYSKSLKMVSSFIDTLLSTKQVDKSKVYIMGLSMGGFGTLELLWRKPKVFAAAVPICGAVDPKKADLYRANLPIWIFHGDKDPVISVSNSRLLYNTLNSRLTKAKYTEYPNVSHDSWKNAFAEKDLLPWLFSQKLQMK